jgi:hypothetical protein
MLVFLLFNHGQLWCFLWYVKLCIRVLFTSTFVCRWLGICTTQMQCKYIQNLISSNMKHGILGKFFLSHNNGELSWIFLVNALWGDVCWIQLNFKIVFDVLCFNLRNSKNASEGECTSVREEKATIATINLTDGFTILCIQDVGVL